MLRKLKHFRRINYSQASEGAAVSFEKLNSETWSFGFWESAFLNKKSLIFKTIKNQSVINPLREA